MLIRSETPDAPLLAELGHRLSRHRLEQNLTQAALARAAGVSKRTIERLEQGASVQLLHFVRVLRALDLAPGLDLALPPAEPSPLDQMRRRRKVRLRATGSRGKKPPKPPKPRTAARWTWGDER